MELIIIGAVVLIVILWIVSVYNKLNTALVKIDEADSGIDVALTKRFDVLTKMVDTVKGYTKYEDKTLKDVVKLRNGMSIGEKIAQNNAMTDEFAKIQVLVENYPDLKASQNYVQLQASIVDVEEHLQAARRLYNSNVSIFNQLLVTIPSNIIAGFMKLSKRDFFEAEEVKKEDVKISL